MFKDFLFFDKKKHWAFESIEVYIEYFARGDNLSASQQHDKKRNFSYDLLHMKASNEKKKTFPALYENRKQTGATWNGI